MGEQLYLKQCRGQKITVAGDTLDFMNGYLVIISTATVVKSSFVGYLERKK